MQKYKTFSHESSMWFAITINCSSSISKIVSQNEFHSLTDKSLMLSFSWCPHHCCLFLPQSLWPSQWSTLGYRKHRHSIAFSLCNKHLTIKQTDELFWRPALLVFSFSSLYNGCTQKKMYIPTKTLYVKRKVKRLYGIFFTHYCSVLVDVVGAFPYTCAGPT